MAFFLALLFPALHAEPGLATLVTKILLLSLVEKSFLLFISVLPAANKAWNALEARSLVPTV